MALFDAYRPKINFHAFGMSEAQRFLLLATLIGIFAGLLVVCFHVTIDFIRWYAVGTLAEKTSFATILSPALGATIASLLVWLVFKKARGSGVNQTKAAVYIYDGYVPFSTVVGKFLACSVSLGSGNSLGPEDPALQMGAGVASLLGRAFRLARDSMRMIAPVGAAAGIAAAFNAPITAVLFVMEEVVVGWHTGVLGSIVLSAVSAVIVSRVFLGDAPLFDAPVFQLEDPMELFVHGLIGVAAGLLAAAFMKTIAWLKGRIHGWPAWGKYALPGAAGALVGVVGIWFPQVMGVGYETVDSALHNRFPWTILLALGLLKILVTLLCFSAGTPGGMFAPTIFAGAMVGGGLGAVAQELQWFPTSTTDAYVLVGMGTFFTGVFRAPMTGVFMVFEVSRSYMIIAPVMIANTIAYLIVRRFQRVPFFQMHAKEDGLDLPSTEVERESRRLRVEDAMRPPRAVFGPRTKVGVALALMQETGDGVRLFKTGHGTWCWVRREELEREAMDARRDVPLDEVVRRDPAPRLYRDVGLDTAMRHIDGHAVLPVVSRANPNELVGTLSLSDIHRAYGIVGSRADTGDNAAAGA